MVNGWIIILALLSLLFSQTSRSSIFTDVLLIKMKYYFDHNAFKPRTINKGNECYTTASLSYHSDCRSFVKSSEAWSRPSFWSYSTLGSGTRKYNRKDLSVFLSPSLFFSFLWERNKDVTQTPDLHSCCIKTETGWWAVERAPRACLGSWAQLLFTAFNRNLIKGGILSGVTQKSEKWELGVGARSYSSFH